MINKLIHSISGPVKSKFLFLNSGETAKPKRHFRYHSKIFEIIICM